jgi:hypothetical protein
MGLSAIHDIRANESRARKTHHAYKTRKYQIITPQPIAEGKQTDFSSWGAAFV